ncbi:MAG: hypothetical protein H6571_19800 [Lewinellaceae bacterium]|nr:hypothetical protein [Lewinellaceae bacterium]
MHFSFSKIVLGILFCFFGGFQIFASDCNRDTSRLTLYHKVQEGKVMLRWMPGNVSQWERGMSEGYFIEKYLIDGSEAGNLQLVFKTREPILPMAYPNWKASDQNEQLALLRDLLYTDNKEETWVSEHYPSEVYTKTKRDRSRFLFSNFIQNSDFEYSLRAGLAFLDENIKTGEQYVYKIYLSTESPEDAAVLIVDPANYKEGTLPELQCDFGSDEVAFAWNTRDHLDDYYGYTLSQSVDGIHFESLTDGPFFNIYDHMDTLDVFDNFYHKWKLPKKDTTYWFRLQGADYFGGMSEHFAVCSGEGYEPVSFSPSIIKTIQADSNYAYIEWKLLKEYEPLIQEFQVFRSDSMDGIYRPVLTGIGNLERSVEVKMAELTNYYRIVAVPHRGPKISSFPTLVMGIDETPPLMPINFQGSIDSSGIARFSWDANREEDLDGYILYKSYVKDSGFARITPKPVKETFFVDTVNMFSGNELVYYKLQAVDKVNNRSPFTEIFEIKKVDRFPPVEPHIYAINNFADRIEVKWHKSGSKDVISHRLFRKIVEADDDWVLLEEYTSVNPATRYMDKNVETGKTYAYTLVAIDDDGLNSEPAQVAIGKAVDYKLQPSMEDIVMNYLPDEHKVRINWQYEVSPSCQFKVYKGSDAARASLMQTVSGDLNEFEDAQVSRGQRYFYYLQAACEDGTRSPVSEKLEITIPR